MASFAVSQWSIYISYLSRDQGPQLSSLFIYPGAFATADSAQLTAWCNAALGRHSAAGSPSDLAADPNHLAPPHRKSEPRPPHDCDVHLIDGDNSEPEARRRKGPMRVVADSFQELVVQSNTSVLLELANDCTCTNDVEPHFIRIQVFQFESFIFIPSAGSVPCKQQAPLIVELHRVLSAVASSSVVVARMNVDHNWIDPAFFPASEKSLPNIKFFVRGNKVCIFPATHVHVVNFSFHFLQKINYRQYRIFISRRPHDSAASVRLPASSDSCNVAWRRNLMSALALSRHRHWRKRALALLIFHLRRNLLTLHCLTSTRRSHWPHAPIAPSRSPRAAEPPRAPRDATWRLTQSCSRLTGCLSRPLSAPCRRWKSWKRPRPQPRLNRSTMTRGSSGSRRRGPSGRAAALFERSNRKSR